MSASVYLAYGGSKLLYVGITGSGKRRLSQHRNGSDWWQEADRIELEHYLTRSRALAREADLIDERRPPFNKAPGHRRKHGDLVSLDGLFERMSAWSKKRLAKWAEEGSLPVADWVEGQPIFDLDEIREWFADEWKAARA